MQYKSIKEIPTEIFEVIKEFIISNEFVFDSKNSIDDLDLEDIFELIREFGKRTKKLHPLYINSTFNLKIKDYSLFVYASEYLKDNLVCDMEFEPYILKK